MLSLFFVKFQNAINYLITLLILFLIKLPNRKVKERSLLLIRLDAIGDYILFRNFLKIIKNSDKFKNHSITLCGNIIWKDLAETFEKEIVNEFIWIDRKKFYRRLLYKYRLLNIIYKSGFDTVIEASHSREILFGDTIVNAAKARISIGSTGSGEKHAVWKRKIFTDNLYSRLISVSNEDKFEFEINKELLSKLLETEIKIKKPELDADIILQSDKIKNEYVLLFPGAGQTERMWLIKNFRETAEFIFENYSLDIALSGSINEAYLLNKVISDNFKRRILNFFGNSLPELAKLISDAKLLLSNDTSAIHFAAAVNTPFICVSNGSHFGRFHPYPKDIFDKGYYIYPPEIMNNLDNIKMLKEKYRFNSDLDINEIKPQIVIEVIKKVLTNQ